MNRNSKQTPAATLPGWKNRIVEQGTRPANQFRFNPQNWRQHPEIQRNALNEVLQKIGWVQGVILSRDSGLLIDGHARIEEALKIDPETPVPFTMVDLSPEEEKAMLALFDPLGSLAETNVDALSDLASMIELDLDHLPDVLAGFINFPEENPVEEVPNLSAPDFNYQNRFGVIVECESESEQQTVYDRLQADGYKVKVVVV